MRPASMRLISLTAGLAGFALLAPAAYAQGSKHGQAPEPVSCAELATDPGNGLLGAPGVKSVNSQVIPASGPNVSYCEVNILYGEDPDQNINIRVGLPLNVLDGARAACRVPGTAGHKGSAAAAAPEPERPQSGERGLRGFRQRYRPCWRQLRAGRELGRHYNLQFINDFIRNGIKQQVLFSKSVAKTYYAIKPAYNYWNGCSTGGRQGYLLAQELGKELDGIRRRRRYWTRFQTAQMWGQIVMRDLVGGPIAADKLNQATASAVLTAMRPTAFPTA